MKIEAEFRYLSAKAQFCFVFMGLQSTGIVYNIMPLNKCLIAYFQWLTNEIPHHSQGPQNPLCLVGLDNLSESGYHTGTAVLL